MSVGGSAGLKAPALNVSSAKAASGGVGLAGSLKPRNMGYNFKDSGFGYHPLTQTSSLKPAAEQQDHHHHPHHRTTSTREWQLPEGQHLTIFSQLTPVQVLFVIGIMSPAYGG